MNDRLYRFSQGRKGSAFQYIGAFTLAQFPDELTVIARYLRVNPDVMDLCITRADGSNLVIKAHADCGVGYAAGTVNVPASA